MPDYRFSHDWFSTHVPLWQRHLSHLRGREGLRYLEVGVFEGRSFLWVLDNLLTATTSRATAVDAFFVEDYTTTFRDNLAASPGRDKVEVIAGESSEVLRSLPRASYDLIYVDGGHGQATLFVDLGLAWGLLREGGLLVLDDYAFGDGKLPDELRPKPVVDAFLTAFAHQVEVVQLGYQAFIRKVAPRQARATSTVPEHLRETCTALGDWYYFWGVGSFVHRDGSGAAAVRHRKLVERALRYRAGRLAVTLALAVRGTRP